MVLTLGMNRRLDVSRWEGILAGVGGVVALFGVYWDDAWHTDIGRDSALIPPHLTLYGGVALIGLAIASWGMRVLFRTRSLATTLRYRPLLFAGIGAVVVLAAGPFDAFWHSAYGRDAVLWSPPHIIAVFASTVMIQGLLSGIDDPRWPLLDEVLAFLLLGNLAVAVMEYETDVPQFSEAFYLPVAVAAALMAAWFARRMTGHRYAVTFMVVGYLVVRLAITGALPMLGRSVPDLPIVYVGLLAMDLPFWRTAVQRYAAGAAGMTVLALAAAIFGVASQSPGPLVAPMVVAVGVLALAVGVERSRLGAVHALILVLLSAGSYVLWFASPANAHDPGQGEEVGTVEVTAASDGSGVVSFAVRASNDCARLEPHRLVARRGGETRAAPLRRADADACLFESSTRLPGRGRWFVYAELRAGQEHVETWMPVQIDRRESHVERRPLYRPSGAAGITAAETATGVVVYLFGFALLGSAMWFARGRHGHGSPRA